jgi:hypothetical protein
MTARTRRLRATVAAVAVAIALVAGAALITSTWSSADPDLAAQQSAASGSEAPSAAAVAPADRCARTTARTVLVDLSEQRMWLCRRGATEATSLVTTGRDGDETPTGRWTVYARQTDRWLSGPGYERQVDVWMPFYEGYGFHDSAWQRIPYGDEQFRTKGSRGCIHVPGAMMKRLHRWGDVGTKVRIVR